MTRARVAGFVLVFTAGLTAGEARAQDVEFPLEAATIASLHRAIQDGRITCRGLVQAYVDRARACNGVCNRLVTEEMAAAFLPDYREYAAAVAATAHLPAGDARKTPPIEFGRMEATASDPAVEQQFGMTIGIPAAGQLRALATLNLRGERSVACKGACDQATGRPGGTCIAGRRTGPRAATRRRWWISRR